MDDRYLLRSSLKGCQMSAVPEAVESTREAVVPRAKPSSAREAGRSWARTLLPVPVATIVALNGLLHAYRAGHGVDRAGEGEQQAGGEALGI